MRRVAAEYRQMGIEAIAVSLMHSYRDPAHERRVRELILEEHPTASCPCPPTSSASTASTSAL